MSATFTMRLKDVHKMENGNVGLDTYPIFDEDYRASLNQKILDHFWNQEIGQETISMWRFAMRRKMNEIMPLYNQQYKLSLLTIDPLSTIKISNIVHTDIATTANATSTGTLNGTTGATSTGENGSTVTGENNSTVTGENSSTVNGTTTGTLSDATTGTAHSETVTGGTGETTATSESESKARAIGSEFPQTMLMANGDYASTGQDNISSTTASSTGTEETSGTSTVDGTTGGTQEQTTGGTSETISTGNDSTVTAGTDETVTTATDSRTDTGTVEQTTGGTENQTGSQNFDTENTTTGYDGHSAELVFKARQMLVNIDMDIINELRELFMLIWSNNDNYTGRSHAYYGFY